jgi:hypothetical protein
VDASTTGCPRDTCSGSPGAWQHERPVGGRHGASHPVLRREHKAQRHRESAGTPNMRKEIGAGPNDVVAPATPRRRERPGAWQRETLGRRGSSAWAPRCIPSVCPGVGTNPGIAHSVLRKIAQDAQRQMREVPAGPSRSPQRAASERDRSPAWSGFSLGRRIYDGRCAFSGARDDVIPPRSSLVGVRAVARLAGSG